MSKPGFWSDTFEQLAELGKSTAKQSAKAVTSTFNPMKVFEKTSNGQSDKGIEKLEQGKSSKQNNTPLDFQKLQEQYENQDKQKTNALRNRLFQLVKSGEEKVYNEKDRKEQEKKRAVFQEDQDKKRRENERIRQQQSASTPHGKERKNIFSHKKVAKREQTEVKPSSGKQ